MSLCEATADPVDTIRGIIDPLGFSCDHTDAVTFVDMVCLSPTLGRLDVYFNEGQPGYSISVQRPNLPSRDYFVYDIEEVVWILKRMYDSKD